MTIPGGYILKARKTLESDLMDKPPLWSKLWDWMLLRCEWRAGQKLERGQLHTSIEEMRDAMSWLVGYRRVKPSIGEIRSCYEGLTKSTMISTAKTTRGMLITVCNYSLYQDPKSYEAHSEQHNEKTTKPEATTQDSKEDKKLRKNQEHDSSETLSRSQPEAPGEPAFISIHLVNNTEHPVTESQVQEFEAAYPSVDVRQQLREMRTWCIANPKRRKTKRGLLSFVNSWLAREQDRGGPARDSPKVVAPKDEAEGRRRLFMKVPDEEKRWHVERFKDVLSAEEIRRYGTNG